MGRRRRGAAIAPPALPNMTMTAPSDFNLIANPNAYGYNASSNTLPTGWSAWMASGLSLSVSGITNEVWDGVLVPALNLVLSGTAEGGGGFNLYFNPSIPWSQGRTGTFKVGVRRTSGGDFNPKAAAIINYHDASNGWVESQVGDTTGATNSSIVHPLTSTKQAVSSQVAVAIPTLVIPVNPGQTVNYGFRVTMPLFIEGTNTSASLLSPPPNVIGAPNPMQITNYIANSRTPDNWNHTGPSMDMTRTTVGSGSVGGVPYFDVRFSGTASASGWYRYVSPGFIPVAAGSVGSPLLFTMGITALSGTVPPVAMKFVERAGASWVRTSPHQIAVPLTSTEQVFTITDAVSAANVTRIDTEFVINFTSGTVYDFVLRFSGAMALNLPSHPGFVIYNDAGNFNQQKTVYWKPLGLAGPNT